MSGRWARVEELRRARPRSRFVRVGLGGMGLLLCAAWVLGDFSCVDLLDARHRRNLARFLREIQPEPLRGRDFDMGIALEWAGEVFADKGGQGVLLTLAISVAAIVLAALGSVLLACPAARNLATAEPFLPLRGTVARERLWRTIVVVARLVLILLRAIPEYVWAFLLLAMIGPTAWPAVLALAIHNTGILGKLTAETIEDIEPGPLTALRGIGAGHTRLALFGLGPMVLPRFLLYFFYRWESCVREATVLGMLGILSLGWWIDDARSRFQYDQMLFLVLLGAAIVLLGDFVSFVTRELVRRS